MSSALVMTLILAQAFGVGLWLGHRAGDPAAGLAVSYALAMVLVIFARSWTGLKNLLR